MELPHTREYLAAESSEHGMLSMLLECAVSYLREGAYAEAAALLTLAQEYLLPAQVQLADVLHSFLQYYQGYRAVQQELQKVSLCFAGIQNELQRHITAFESAVSALTQSIKDVEVILKDGQNHLNERGPENLLTQSIVEVDGKDTAWRNNDTVLPGLSVTCFGRFTVKRFGEVVTLCPSRNGQGILRYLIAQGGHYATSDVLKAIFWPEDEGEVGQRKLHVAISALRRSLHTVLGTEHGDGYILYKNGMYLLNPNIEIVTDVNEFMQCYSRGQQRQHERIALYERACQLYKGPFLYEDLYADWSSLQREQLSQAYLVMCRILAEHYMESQHYQEAAQWATALLKEDRCNEVAHRLLIQIYAAQGRRSEAHQQYQRCEMMLREELGVQPMPETQRALQIVIGKNF